MGTFGQTLRQAREDLGASLAEAERETRISRRYLEALETENEAALPAAVYTRGFIKIYCQYLGLNPEGMVDLFGPQQALVDNVTIRPIPAEIKAALGASAAGRGGRGPDAGVVARRLPVGPVYFVPGERRAHRFPAHDAHTGNAGGCRGNAIAAARERPADSRWSWSVAEPSIVAAGGTRARSGG